MVAGFREKGPEFKTVETPLAFVTKGIRNLKVLRCSSKKSGSKASAEW